jgi:hypothetical protein
VGTFTRQQRYLSTILEQELFATVTTAAPATGLMIRRDDLGDPRLLKDDEDNNKNGGANAGKSSYLVDGNENPYEPYALSWRYLGMYVDCDLTFAMSDVDGLSRRDRGRQLGGGGGGGNDNNDNHNNGGEDDCSRKVLWAAVGDAAGWREACYQQKLTTHALHCSFRL